MTITQQEFEAILGDPTKRIDGDIDWRERPDQWPAMEFRAPVLSEPDWPLFVAARWNPKAGKLSYSIIHSRVRRSGRRIVGLDLGLGHRNPDETRVAEVHKHVWSEQFGSGHAYEPPDITAPWYRPVAVWGQFCAEVGIVHAGILREPVWQEGWTL